VDVDDGSTGELEGIFKGRPVLLSRFEQLPAKGILEDMISRSDFGASFKKPALTLPDPDTMLADVSKGDVKDAFK